MKELKSDEDEYYFEILYDTMPDDPANGAIRVFDGISKCLLPKSEIKIEQLKGRDAKITIPEWLAKDRGII
jgi:hypothetical protein